MNIWFYNKFNIEKDKEYMLKNLKHSFRKWISLCGKAHFVSFFTHCSSPLEVQLHRSICYFQRSIHLWAKCMKNISCAPRWKSIGKENRRKKNLTSYKSRDLAVIPLQDETITPFCFLQPLPTRYSNVSAYLQQCRLSLH